MATLTAVEIFLLQLPPPDPLDSFITCNGRSFVPITNGKSED